MKRKVIAVFGTRPEAIKMMPVVLALRRLSDVHCIVVNTGQHTDLVDEVIELFGISPDLDLGIMTAGQSLHAITSRVILGMQAVFADHPADLVLVHGDTTTAMATALAAFYSGIPVGHVEAGLRSHNLQHPWPEEYNRISIDTVATLLFAPTEAAADNLRPTATAQQQILVTGNTGIDALLQARDKFVQGAPDRVQLDDEKRLILVTCHRRENFGDNLVQICEALERLSRRSDVSIVFPVHPNPNVGRIVHGRLGGLPNIALVPPMPYDQMVKAMDRAHLFLTDSGGLQEEGAALGKPVLVLREVTERPEAAASGILVVVGTRSDDIVSAASRCLDDHDYYHRIARPNFAYGDGKAAERIVSAVRRHLEALDEGADKREQAPARDVSASDPVPSRR